MENILFFKIEIFTFLISLAYIWYYILEKFFIIYINIKNIVRPNKKILNEKAKKIKKIIKNKESIKTKKQVKNKNRITPDQAQEIAEILKRVKLNISKWFIDNARTQIIEWLTIDKYNKELNFELALLYENDWEYKKSEYIYLDLLKVYEDTFEILKKLWFNLAMQKRFEDSMSIYLEADKKKKNDIEIIEILADLTYELKYFKKSIKYLKLFLKQNPRNTEKLKMRWYSYEVLWKIEDALISYNRVLELQPYNSQVLEKVKHLKW